MSTLSTFVLFMSFLLFFSLRASVEEDTSSQRVPKDSHPHAPVLFALLAAQFQVILGRILELVLIILRQVAHHVLIDGVCQEQHLQVLLDQLLQEWRLCKLRLLVPCMYIKPE